jgi:hypothetical protein
MPPNRRAYPRFVKRLRARARDDASGPFRACFTADVSVSGIFVESVWIPRFARVEIEVFLASDKDGKPVPLVGQLVRGARVPPQLLRVAKGGFALKLLEAPPAWYEYCLALAK